MKYLEFGDESTRPTRTLFTRIRVTILDPALPEDETATSFTFSPLRRHPDYDIPDADLMDVGEHSEEEIAEHAQKLADQYERRDSVPPEEAGQTVLLTRLRLYGGDPVPVTHMGDAEKGMDLLAGIDVRLANLPEPVAEWMRAHIEAAPAAPWRLIGWVQLGNGKCIRMIVHRMVDAVLSASMSRSGHVLACATWFNTVNEGTALKTAEFVDEVDMPLPDLVPAQPA